MKVSGALHKIGLAATVSDVAAMMASVDPGGELKALRLNRLVQLP